MGIGDVVGVVVTVWWWSLKQMGEGKEQIPPWGKTIVRTKW